MYFCHSEQTSSVFSEAYVTALAGGGGGFDATATSPVYPWEGGARKERTLDSASDYLKPLWMATERSNEMACISVAVTTGQ